MAVIFTKLIFSSFSSEQIYRFSLILVVEISYAFLKDNCLKFVNYEDNIRYLIFLLENLIENSIENMIFYLFVV